MNKYQILGSKFNEINEQDLNNQENYAEIFKKINEKIIQNKNDIEELNNCNVKNYKIFEQIKRNFKIIDTEIAKINNIQKNEKENNEKIDEINKKLIKLENALNENKNQMKNFQRDSINKAIDGKKK